MQHTLNSNLILLIPIAPDTPIITIISFKFQSDSINTYTDRDGRKVHTALNSNLILLILVDYVVYAPTGNKTLNSNLILLILLGGRMEWTLYRSLNSNLILLIQMTGQWLLLFSTTLNSNLILLIQHGFI